jgi:hypothetical protein
MSNKIQLHLPFVIYDVKWMDENKMVICGYSFFLFLNSHSGGGQGIPNKVLVSEIKEKEIKNIHELELKEDVPICMDVGVEFIIFNTLDKLYLLDKKLK